MGITDFERINNIEKQQKQISMIMQNENKKQSKSIKNDSDQTHVIISKLKNTLQKAQTLFQQLKNSLGEARVILVKANFLVNDQTAEFHAMKEDLIKANQSFEQQFQIQHAVKCLIYLALIDFQLEDYQTAKESILSAIDKATEIQDHQQIKKATDILQQIMLKIQINSNNVVLLMNSFPLVETKANAELELTPEKMSNCHIEKLSSIMSLDSLKKQITIKDEILTLDQLKYIKEYGCRILVISQTCYESNISELLVETGFGTSKRMNASELYQALKPKEGFLSVDLVLVNIRNGQEIAEVFKKLGVQQVFTLEGSFKQADFSDTARYFSVELIKKLVQQQSFFKAQATVLKEINNQYGISVSSAIKWLQGKDDNPGQKLFDENSYDERYAISDGLVEDQSSASGPTNLKIQLGPIIGRRKEMFTILK